MEKGTYLIRKDFITDVRGYVPKASHEAFEQEDNAGKNRYDDIILLDSTRVRLQNNGGDGILLHRRIVGEYIRFRLHPRQLGDDHLRLPVHLHTGPAGGDGAGLLAHDPPGELSGAYAFHVLVVHCAVQLIIQLCQNVEGGEPKCEAYFPATPGETAEYSRFSVKMMGKPKKIESRNDLLQTKLQVKNGDQSQQVRIPQVIPITPCSGMAHPLHGLARPLHPGISDRMPRSARAREEAQRQEAGRRPLLGRRRLVPH